MEQQDVLFMGHWMQMKINKIPVACPISLGSLCLLLTALPLIAAGPKPPIQTYSVTDLGGPASTSPDSAFPGYVPARVVTAEYDGPGKQMTEMVSRFQRDYGAHLAGMTIVGNADVGQHEEHAFVFRNNGLTDLGVLPGGSWSCSNALNHYGQVVGYSYIHPFGPVWHAFLYSGGKMIDLNTRIRASSGWILQDGCCINDAGQIVGVGNYKGRRRMFLLTPK